MNKRKRMRKGKINKTKDLNSQNQKLIFERYTRNQNRKEELYLK